MNEASFQPAEILAALDDLRRQATEMSLAGHRIAVAALSDVIRSKEAANRPKDQIALPTLRLLLQRLGRTQTVARLLDHPIRTQDE